jgi:hypothetical protein
MIGSRRRLGLAAESFQRAGIARDVRAKEFESNRALELEVLGFADHAHAALAQLLDDLVVQQALTDHRGCPEMQIFSASSSESTSGSRPGQLTEKTRKKHRAARLPVSLANPRRPAWEVGQCFVFNNINAHGVDSGYEKRQQNTIPFRLAC